MTTAERRKQERQFNEVIGPRIKSQRILAGLTQTDLADALGISFQQVQKWERGVNRISAQQLLVAADKLGVHPMQLLTDRSVEPITFTRPDLGLTRRLARLTRQQKQAVSAMLDAFLDRNESRRDDAAEKGEAA